MASIMHFYVFLRALPGAYPNTSDTNTRTDEDPFEDVPGTSRGNRLIIDVEN